MKINADSLEWQYFSHEDFTYFRKSLGNKAGGQKLGASLYKLLPGKKAFPFHFHHANEEAILVLEGEGTLRLNNESLIIKKNDYIALPSGKNHAHQIINTGDDPLAYLCFSTMIIPEVMEYPDSSKIGIMTGSAPGEEKNAESYKAFFYKERQVPYFEKEK